MSADDAFLSRWSRRKAQARHSPVPDESPKARDSSAGPVPVVAPVVAPTVAPATASAAQAASPTGSTPAEAPPPAPTMVDVAGLTRQSDFSRFVAPGVDRDVKNAALKKLFDDPHFNVMDGLDVYIDDYNKPDPLPLASLRKMAQAAFLGLVEPEPAATAAVAGDGLAPPASRVPAPDEPGAAPTAGMPAVSDEDTDLRLQPHDATGCGGAEDSAATDQRRQC